jgi:hypothetical protein
MRWCRTDDLVDAGAHLAPVSPPGFVSCSLGERFHPISTSISCALCSSWPTSVGALAQPEFRSVATWLVSCLT